MKTIVSLLLITALLSCKKTTTTPTTNSTNNSNSNINDTCWVNYENIQNVTIVEIDNSDTKWFYNISELYSFDNKWNYFTSSKYFHDKLIINPINNEKKMYSQYPGALYSWGITTFDGINFKNDNLSNLPIHSAVYDGLGNLYFTSYNLLLKINYSTNKIDTVYEGISGKIKKYYNNTLWISNFKDGLLKYDISKKKITETFNQSNSMISGEFIGDIVFDNLGNMWVATDGGLSKYDGKAWVNFNSVNSGLVDNGITSIAVDKFNNIWVGTGKGLSKYNNSNWTNYTPLNSKILDYGILDIAVDKQDNKWIVTEEGVSKLSKTKSN